MDNIIKKKNSFKRANNLIVFMKANMEMPIMPDMTDAMSIIVDMAALL